MKHEARISKYETNPKCKYSILETKREYPRMPLRRFNHWNFSPPLNLFRISYFGFRSGEEHAPLCSLPENRRGISHDFIHARRRLCDQRGIELDIPEIPIFNFLMQGGEVEAAILLAAERVGDEDQRD